MTEAEPRQRLDKWLWHARFFKTRSLAAEVVAAGRVRVDSVPVSKPSRAIGPGNVLTFPQGKTIRVVEIRGLATRRGPASEAQHLYADLSPPELQSSSGPRPTKRERRTFDRLEGSGEPS